MRSLAARRRTAAGRGHQLRRGDAGRRKRTKDSPISGEACFPGGGHSECWANSGEASAHRMKGKSSHSPEDSGRTGHQLRRGDAGRRNAHQRWSTSDEARFPGEEHSECGANSGEASVHRRRRKSTFLTVICGCFLLMAPLCIMEQRDFVITKKDG